MQATLGTTLAIAVALYGYIYLNDPLVLDSVHGAMIGPYDLKLYLSGYKRHEDCPGQWNVTLNTYAGATWLVSDTQPTGTVPVGRMNDVPVQIHFLERPTSGDYTATVNVQYNCLLTFRHQASFELIVP